jgi:hypothetical protein
MGGLFGGGGSKGETVRHTWSDPVDMSGAKTPGDDKMRQQMTQVAAAEDQKAAKAGQTLLGKSAGTQKMGSTDTTKSTAQKTTAVNYA